MKDLNKSEILSEVERLHNGFKDSESKDMQASLTGFSISRDPYGTVEWEGAVDVRFANFAARVHTSRPTISGS